MPECLLLTWINVNANLISNYTHYKVWDEMIYTLYMYAIYHKLIDHKLRHGLQFLQKTLQGIGTDLSNLGNVILMIWIKNQFSECTN